MGIKVECDDCNCDLDSTDNFYCEECYNKKDREVLTLQVELDTAKNDYEELKEENERLSGIIDKLNEGLEGVDGE